MLSQDCQFVSWNRAVCRRSHRRKANRARLRRSGQVDRVPSCNAHGQSERGLVEVVLAVTNSPQPCGRRSDMSWVKFDFRIQALAKASPNRKAAGAWHAPRSSSTHCSNSANRCARHNASRVEYRVGVLRRTSAAEIGVTPSPHLDPRIEDDDPKTPLTTLPRH